MGRDEKGGIWYFKYSVPKTKGLNSYAWRLTQIKRGWYNYRGVVNFYTIYFYNFVFDFNFEVLIWWRTTLVTQVKKQSFDSYLFLTNFWEKFKIRKNSFIRITPLCSLNQTSSENLFYKQKKKYKQVWKFLFLV